MSSAPHRQPQTETVASCAHTAVGDSPLLTRLQQRHQTALGNLYDRYAPILYSIAFEQFGSVAASETMVLDVFVQFWQTAPAELTPSQSVGTQLLQLAAQYLETQTFETARLQDFPLKGCGPQVLRALSQLTEPQQLLLGLALYQRLPLTTLAAQSNLSTRAVKSQCRSALRRLHTLLNVGE